MADFLSTNTGEVEIERRAPILLELYHQEPIKVSGEDQRKALTCCQQGADKGSRGQTPELSALPDIGLPSREAP